VPPQSGGEGYLCTLRSGPRGTSLTRGCGDASVSALYRVYPIPSLSRRKVDDHAALETSVATSRATNREDIASRAAVDADF